MRIPAALFFDEQVGRYVVGDTDTSGGDIGAQVPIFPTVWVSMLLCPWCMRAPCLHRACAQVKGTKNFDGRLKETWTRDNVSVQKGWVVFSGNRREWLFAQLAEDVSEEAINLYGRINRLGKKPISHHPGHRLPSPSAHLPAVSLMAASPVLASSKYAGPAPEAANP